MEGRGDPRKKVQSEGYSCAYKNYPIAPRREHANAADSAARSEAASIPAPLSTADTNPAVNASPAPTVSTTSTGFGNPLSGFLPRPYIICPSAPRVQTRYFNDGYPSKIAFAAISKSRLFFANIVSKTIGNSASFSFKISAFESEKFKTPLLKYFWRKLASKTFRQCLGRIFNNSFNVPAETGERWDSVPKQKASQRATIAFAAGVSAISSHAAGWRMSYSGSPSGPFPTSTMPVGRLSWTMTASEFMEFSDIFASAAFPNLSRPTALIIAASQPNFVQKYAKLSGAPPKVSVFPKLSQTISPNDAILFFIGLFF